MSCLQSREKSSGARDGERKREREKRERARGQGRGEGGRGQGGGGASDLFVIFVSYVVIRYVPAM